MKLCFTICVFTTIFIYKMLLFSGKPPKFQTVSVATKVLQGSDATLYCNPQGGPPTNITWMKDDKTIDINQPNSRFSIDSSNSLLIKETQQSDEVPFTCKAVNGYGEATLTWNVDILGKTWLHIVLTRYPPLRLLPTPSPNQSQVVYIILPHTTNLISVVYELF